MAKNKGIILNISSDLSVIAPDQRLYSHLGITKPISYSVIKHSLTGQQNTWLHIGPNIM